MRRKIVNSSSKQKSPAFWYGLAVLLVISATFLIYLLAMPADFYYDQAQAASIEAAIKDDIGTKVTSGDNVLLLAGYKKDTEIVELTYRKINDLEHFIKNAKRPVLMAVREQTNQFANPIINPYLEDIAEQYYRKLYVVLVEPDQDTEFMRKLEFKYTPTFYLWQQGQVKLETSGFKEESLADFKKKVEALLK